MKSLNDRTARLTEKEEKNFKILKWVVMGLCIAVPIAFYAMLMIGKPKVFEKKNRARMIQDLIFKDIVK
jgi:hypothetical protein